MPATRRLPGGSGRAAQLEGAYERSEERLALSRDTIAENAQHGALARALATERYEEAERQAEALAQRVASLEQEQAATLTVTSPSWFLSPVDAFAASPLGESGARPASGEGLPWSLREDPVGDVHAASAGSL